jgi:hypothetical protein
MNIQTCLAEGPYTFKSVSGYVYLCIPSTDRFTAQLHSISGNLASAFPNTGMSHQHGS